LNQPKNIFPHNGKYNCFFGCEKFLKKEKMNIEDEQLLVLNFQFSNRINFFTPNIININNDGYREHINYVYLKFFLNKHDFEISKKLNGEIKDEIQNYNYKNCWETIYTTKSYEIITEKFFNS
jgi:hypothetical protein